MFLALDAGNSNLVIALRQNGDWTHLWRIETAHIVSAEFLQHQIKMLFLEDGLSLDTVQAVGISSVVPPINSYLKDSIQMLDLGNAVFVGPSIYDLLPIQVPRPDQIGTDLVADAMAAYHLFPGYNSLVVDFGTALTFTATHASEKRMCGVNIMPGIKTALKALFQNTAQLPDVPLEYPDNPLGQNTIHAIQAGMIHGYTGAVKEMIRVIRTEMGADLKVLATGGLSHILKNLHSEFDVVSKHLTLEGIFLIHQAVKNND